MGQVLQKKKSQPMAGGGNGKRKFDDLGNELPNVSNVLSDINAALEAGKEETERREVAAREAEEQRQAALRPRNSCGCG